MREYPLQYASTDKNLKNPTIITLFCEATVYATAENHTFPWCFVTQNGAMEHTESCHTLVHDLVKDFIHEIIVTCGHFWKHVPFSMKNMSIMFLLKKLLVLLKLMLLKVDQYELNRWTYYDFL